MAPSQHQLAGSPDGSVGGGGSPGGGSSYAAAATVRGEAGASGSYANVAGLHQGGQVSLGRSTDVPYR
jgi:hypothetical protein